MHQHEAAAAALPFVSVVVPAHNGADSIRRCLEPLLAQTYPPRRFEIIVVDDGSTDDVADVARAALAGGSVAFQVLRKEKNSGPASARNAGIHAARGDLIAFIDADCVAEPDWLLEMVRALEESGAAGVGGPIIEAPSRNWVANYLDSGGFYRHRVRRGEVDYLLTINVAFRRSALEDIGWFAEHDGVFAEDADLSFRLRQRGHWLLLGRAGSVTHCGTPTTISRLALGLFRYGYGNMALSSTWPRARHPVIEIVRHVGAIGLSPWLALRRAGRVGTLRALTFWPLVVIEHGSFVAGMLSGLSWRLVAGGARRG